MSQNFETFSTPYKGLFLVFGVPNAKYLAFGTPDENSLRNQVIFQDRKVDIQLSSNQICRRALEFSFLAIEEHLSPLPHPLF